MVCPGCGSPNPERSRYCHACGTRLAVACPGCGTAALPAARFCTACGAPLGADRPAGDVPDASPPRFLAERILQSRGELAGERKKVTVLFADLRGSMELLAERDPEEARAILDPVLTLMMEAVHQYEGTVNQVMGDGVMALFGAPLAHEDHAVRACYAALRMQQTIADLSGQLRRERGVTVEIRVGLNSGEVVVRSIGSDLHMDYSAIGETTHLASRMEQLAPAGRTYLTDRTRRLAEGFVTIERVGTIPVRGLAEPVEAFELTGAGPVHSRIELAAARGLSRFVGRDHELDSLARLAAQVAAGLGVVVGVQAEAGMGKSRLLREFTRSAALAGWRVLEAGGAPHESDTGGGPIRRLLAGYFGLEPADGTRRLTEQVTAGLLALDSGLLVELAPLLALLDVPVDDPRWQALDPAHRRRRSADAVARLLVRESRDRPLCVVVEDLHWIDPESQGLLDRLIDGLPASRLLLLLTYRPKYEPGAAHRSHYTRLTLDPLPESQARELLGDLLGSDPGLAPLVTDLVRATDGNPFFLEECVRHLAQTGVLAGERGAHRLAGPVRRIAVPDSIHAVLASRIDQLPAADKAVLREASCIGNDVPLPLLEAICDLDADQLRLALGRLVGLEMLDETALFPEARYSFRHALTLEVVYGGLLRERRRELDVKLVDAIESRFADRLDEHIERLAHHAFRGEAWERAVRYQREAGARAFARSANRAAADHFERALAALDHLPQTPETLMQAIDVRLDLRYALSPLGELARMSQHLEEARALAARIGDRRRLGLVSAFLANYFVVMLETDRAIEHGERALAIGTEVGDPAVLVPAQVFLGLVYFGRGLYARAADLGRRTLPLADAGPTARHGMAVLPGVYARTVLAWCAAETGEFAEGVDHARQALEIARSFEHPYSLVFASSALGTVLLHRGDAADAAGALEDGLRACESAGVPAGTGMLSWRLASAYVQAGRIDEAYRCLTEAIARAKAMGDPIGFWLRAAGRAEADLAAGRADEALARARQAVEMARAMRWHGIEPWMLRLAAEAVATCDPPRLEEAIEGYRAAAGIAERLGMRPLLARCQLGLADVHRRLGQRELAQDAAGAARRAFVALGMRSWLARAETTLLRL